MQPKDASLQTGSSSCFNDSAGASDSTGEGAGPEQRAAAEQPTREASFQMVVPPMPTTWSPMPGPFLSSGAAGPTTPLTLTSPSIREGMTCRPPSFNVSPAAVL